MKSNKDAETRSATRAEMAARIKELRVSRGIEQADLAEMVGVSRQSISNIERGASIPRESTLNRILEVLGVEQAVISFDEQTDRWLVIIGSMLETLPKSERPEAFTEVVEVLTRRQRRTGFTVVSGSGEDELTADEELRTAASHDTGEGIDSLEDA